jgi:hypothetical protein
MTRNSVLDGLSDRRLADIHSIDNPEHCVATFDLEKVLCCPSGKIGTIFYKRN